MQWMVLLILTFICGHSICACILICVRSALRPGLTPCAAASAPAAAPSKALSSRFCQTLPVRFIGRPRSVNYFRVSVRSCYVSSSRLSFQLFPILFCQIWQPVYNMSCNFKGFPTWTVNFIGRLMDFPNFCRSLR